MLKLNRSIAEAEKSFQDILAYVQGDAQQHALHETENSHTLLIKTCSDMVSMTGKLKRHS